MANDLDTDERRLNEIMRRAAAELIRRYPKVDGVELNADTDMGPPTRTATSWPAGL